MKLYLLYAITAICYILDTIFNQHKMQLNRNRQLKERMDLEQPKLKSAIGVGGKIITIAAFAVATVSVSLPILAYIKKFPLNLMWPDLLAIALMVVAGYLFKGYQQEKNIVKLYACHFLLCTAMVSSNIVWAGIPFVDILMFLSASLFGMAALFFLIMLLSAYLWKRMITRS